MTCTFGVLQPDDAQMDKSNLINRSINKLSRFLDRVCREGGYISDRDSHNSNLAMSIKKCQWLLKQEYPLCDFQITYNGFLPIVGATIFVRAITGEVDTDKIIRALNNEARVVWNDPEYGFFDREICKVGVKFIND